MDTTARDLNQAISERDRSALQGQIEGPVILPGDSQYDAARRAWNLAVTQFPAGIVAAQSPADVAAAVRFAAAHDLGVAVETTGHGVIRPADRALLILTGALDDVSVNPQAQTARFGGGVTWAPVLAEAAGAGLAPLLGSSPGIGAVGYTLGGGMGWLVRKYGLAVDSVVSFQVVTAGGQILTVSEDENPDLFWGMRGSKGSLGVVTEMEVRLAPVARVYGGNLFYPAAVGPQVFSRYAEWIETNPEELTSSIVAMNFPPLDFVPEGLRGQSFVIVRGCYAGPEAQGEALLDFWRNWQKPAIDQWQEMPFTQVAAISNDPEEPVPAGMSGAWMHTLDDAAAEIILHDTLPQQGPPTLLFTEVRHVGGAMGQVDPQACAFGLREASLVLDTVGMAPTQEAYDFLQGYNARLMTELEPFLTGGVYQNFVDGAEAVGRTRQAFLPDSFARLQELKARYDPQDLFCYGFDLQPD